MNVEKLEGKKTILLSGKYISKETIFQNMTYVYNYKKKRSNLPETV